MGRTQSFTTDEVVRCARRVFWEQGYDNTNLPDLELAMGIQRSSIYHAFGSKRSLFHAAVESYLAEIVRPQFRPLVSADPAPTAILEYLSALREYLAQQTRGCLLLNAVGTSVARDEGMQKVLSQYRQELLTALTRGLQARFPERADNLRAGEACVGLVIAALVLSRIDAAYAVSMIDAAVTMVT